MKTKYLLGALALTMSTAAFAADPALPLKRRAAAARRTIMARWPAARTGMPSPVTSIKAMTWAAWITSK